MSLDWIGFKRFRIDDLECDTFKGFSVSVGVGDGYTDWVLPIDLRSDCSPRWHKFDNKRAAASSSSWMFILEENTRPSDFERACLMNSEETIEREKR